MFCVANLVSAVALRLLLLVTHTLAGGKADPGLLDQGGRSCTCVGGALALAIASQQCLVPVLRTSDGERRQLLMWRRGCVTMEGWASIQSPNCAPVLG